MNKFKVGDRVRVLTDRAYPGLQAIGEYGHVIQINVYHHAYNVLCCKLRMLSGECSGSTIFHPDDLELTSRFSGFDYSESTRAYAGLAPDAIVLNEDAAHYRKYTMAEAIAKLTPTTVKNTMEKISNFVKKLIDPDAQALMEAGFIGKDMRVTAEGTNELLSILFFANKPALVAAAKDIIAEAEKAKANE